MNPSASLLLLIECSKISVDNCMREETENKCDVNVKKVAIEKRRRKVDASNAILHLLH